MSVIVKLVVRVRLDHDDADDVMVAADVNEALEAAEHIGITGLDVDAEPNVDQALALLSRVKTNGLSTVQVKVFDLPDGYVQVTETSRNHGFVCGIAPDGRVSS